MSDILERLQRPFAHADIEWTVTYSYGDSYEDVIIGVAPYVKRESIMTRLDTVCGQSKWANELSPHKEGLYHGLKLYVPDEDVWVIKWDGAAINDSGRIDSVKTVHSQSFRRAAEMFGIGRYLKFMPQLFAVKRPPKDYDAKEKTRVKRDKNYFDVRWDPPAVPKEFLPVYMTPEQYALLRRLRNYFTGEPRSKIDAFIDTWEGDPDSIDYGEAEEKITGLLGFLKQRVSLPTHFEARNVRNRQDDKPKPDIPDDNKKSKSGKKKDKPSAEYVKTFRLVKNMINELVDSDVTGAYFAERDELKEMQEIIDESIKGKEPIPFEDLKSWSSRLEKPYSNMKDADDDLPF